MAARRSRSTAGKSWSTQDNQPTAQFYHVIVDDAYPYRLYSGQQDNTSVIIKSRGATDRASASAIGRTVQVARARTSASIAANPRYVYGGCYVGILEGDGH